MKCKSFRSMRLCLCKWYYSLLWLLCCKFCDNMSPATMKNKTHNHQKLESYTCNLLKPHHDIMKTCINKFDTMNWITMRLCLCKWYYSLFWLILISNFVSTCHHAKWHLQPIKVLIIQNWKLTHMASKKKNIKTITTKWLPWNSKNLH